jgi:hypothetical protein
VLSHNYDTLMQQNKNLFSSGNRFTGEAADALGGLFGSIRQMVMGNRRQLEGAGNWSESLWNAGFSLQWAIDSVKEVNHWGAEETRRQYEAEVEQYMNDPNAVDPPSQPWFVNSHGEVIYTPSHYPAIDGQMTERARNIMRQLAAAYHSFGSNLSARPAVTALPPIPPPKPPTPGGPGPGGTDGLGGPDGPGGPPDLKPPPGGSADTPPPPELTSEPPPTSDGPPPPSGEDKFKLGAAPPPDIGPPPGSHLPLSPPPPDLGPGSKFIDPKTGLPIPSGPPPGSGGGPPPLPILAGAPGGPRGGATSDLGRTITSPALRSAFPFAGKAPAGLQGTSAIGGAGALSRGGLVEEALHAPVVGGAGRSGTGAGMPFLPPMGAPGAPGTNEKSERERTTWLQEDRDIWAVGSDASPAVIRGGDPTAPEDGSQWDDSETPVYTPARPAPQPTTGRQQQTPR